MKKRPDFNILGTDLAPNMIELAKINNPQASFQLLDSRAITSLNKTYGAIMCGFYLPYLSKEEAIQLIADAAKILAWLTNTVLCNTKLGCTTAKKQSVIIFFIYIQSWPNYKHRP